METLNVLFSLAETAAHGSYLQGMETDDLLNGLEGVSTRILPTRNGNSISILHGFSEIQTLTRILPTRNGNSVQYLRVQP